MGGSCEGVSWQADVGSSPGLHTEAGGMVDEQDCPVRTAKSVQNALEHCWMHRSLVLNPTTIYGVYLECKHGRQLLNCFV